MTNAINDVKGNPGTTTDNTGGTTYNFTCIAFIRRTNWKFCNTG